MKRKPSRCVTNLQSTKIWPTQQTKRLIWTCGYYDKRAWRAAIYESVVCAVSMCCACPVGGVRREWLGGYVDDGERFCGGKICDERVWLEGVSVVRLRGPGRAEDGRCK